MHIPANAIDNLQKFIAKQKFGLNEQTGYTGLENKTLLQPANEAINNIAKGFIKVCQTNPTEENFREQLRKGLQGFSDIARNSEDQDQVGFYCEEIMDYVGLQSSGGVINNWRYGFDPATDTPKK